MSCGPAVAHFWAKNSKFLTKPIWSEMGKMGSIARLDPNCTKMAFDPKWAHLGPIMMKGRSFYNRYSTNEPQ